jgi:hypothetical protein
VGVENVYDLFTEFSRLVEQAQIRGIADRLLGNGCIVSAKLTPSFFQYSSVA